MRRSAARPPPLLLALVLAIPAVAPGDARAQDGSAPAPEAPARPPSADPDAPVEPAPTPESALAPQAPAAPEAAPPEKPQPGTGTSGTAQPPQPAVAPAKSKEDTWLDVGHAFIEQRIFAPLLRFDRFFSDERELEAERSRSFLRWRSEIRFEERAGGPRFTTGVRANLRLPGLDKQLERLRVVIEGETRNTIATLFPPEPGETTPPAEEPVGTAGAELRFRLWETLVTHGDVGAGVLVKLPPGAFGRVRLRFVVPVRQIVLTRYLATGFWRTDTHLGTSAALEAERQLGPKLAVRLGGNGTLTQRSNGVEWQGDLAVLAKLDARSAAQTGVTVNGATRAIPALDRWRIYARLRRDFYRRWLFFEVEPDLSWPWTPALGRHPIWGISWRLEVQFQGNERPVTPPAELRRASDVPPSHEPDGGRVSYALPPPPPAR